MERKSKVRTPGARDPESLRRRIHRCSVALVAIVAAQIILAGCAAAGPRENPPLEPAKLLRDLALDGWTRDGDAQIFTPETLFEYIDGAADAYLGFEFEELAAASYDGESKRSLTIEIYRHAGLRNAFGIYTQERPQQGNFVEIGTEGYYDTGILNFFHGPFYVKVMGFRLGDEDRNILNAVAKNIADRIGGKPAFPELLACFPAEGRVAHTERFLARDVLGHGFLHSAYAADYESKGAVMRLFLFEGKDEADARKMLDEYLELAGTAPSSPAGPGRPETYTFRDPRRTEGEPAAFRLLGRYLWGVFATDSLAASYMDRIETNLKERGFFE
ncbi:MAG: hypothetical protein H6Q78_1593 [Candidatus Krumholzibacteriota bacterium]|nr:hypothetical protein [Candidatus Krumholzibacteriota bacterium]